MPGSLRNYSSNFVGVSQHLLILISIFSKAQNGFLVSYVFSAISHHNIFISFNFLPCPNKQLKLNNNNNNKTPSSPNTKIRRYTFLQAMTMHPVLGILSLISRRNFHNSHIYFSEITKSKRSKTRKTVMHVFELEKILTY